MVYLPLFCLLSVYQPGITAKLEAWTQPVGTFLTTFDSGIVDKPDRIFLCGYPVSLSRVPGVSAEVEILVLTPHPSLTGKGRSLLRG